MEISGLVKRIGSVQQVTEKFKKRELIIEDNSNINFPQVYQFIAAQDKCSLLDGLHGGDRVKVHFNLNGREYMDKQGNPQVFNTLNIWKIEKESGEQPQYAPPVDLNQASDDSDLPF